MFLNYTLNAFVTWDEPAYLSHRGEPRYVVAVEEPARFVSVAGLTLHRVAPALAGWPVAIAPLSSLAAGSFSPLALCQSC